MTGQIFTATPSVHKLDDAIVISTPLYTPSPHTIYFVVVGLQIRVCSAHQRLAKVVQAVACMHRMVSMLRVFFANMWVRRGTEGGIVSFREAFLEDT